MVLNVCGLCGREVCFDCWSDIRKDDIADAVVITKGAWNGYKENRDAVSIG